MFYCSLLRPDQLVVLTREFRAITIIDCILDILRLVFFSVSCSFIDLIPSLFCHSANRPYFHRPSPKK